MHCHKIYNWTVIINFHSIFCMLVKCRRVQFHELLSYALNTYHKFILLNNVNNLMFILHHRSIFYAYRFIDFTTRVNLLRKIDMIIEYFIDCYWLWIRIIERSLTNIYEYRHKETHQHVYKTKYRNCIKRARRTWCNAITFLSGFFEKCACFSLRHYIRIHMHPFWQIRHMGVQI